MNSYKGILLSDKFQVFIQNLDDIDLGYIFAAFDTLLDSQCPFNSISRIFVINCDNGVGYFIIPINGRLNNYLMHIVRKANGDMYAKDVSDFGDNAVSDRFNKLFGFHKSS